MVRHENENCPMIDATKKKKYKCDKCPDLEFSSKQYLNEHIHEVHLKTPSCYCKACGKGYFKHCNLVHHKKSCLAYLTPGLVAHPVVNPTVQPVVNPTVTTTTATDTTTTSSSTTTTTTTAETTETEQVQHDDDDDDDDNRGNPLIGRQFSFSDPMYLPNLE